MSQASVSRAVVAVMVLALTVPGAVWADTKSNDIPEDRQAAGTLGIDRWEMSHLADGFVRHTITFTGEWDNSLLLPDDDGESGSIELRFKVWGRNGAVKNRLLRVTVNGGGSLNAAITGARVTRDFGQPNWNAAPPGLGHANAWRPDGRTLQVEFHPRVQNQKKWPYNLYRWAVASVYIDNREGSEDCRGFEEDEEGTVIVIDPSGCRDRTFFVTHDLRR